MANEETIRGRWYIVSTEIVSVAVNQEHWRDTLDFLAHGFSRSVHPEYADVLAELAAQYDNDNEHYNPNIMPTDTAVKVYALQGNYEPHMLANLQQNCYLAADFHSTISLLDELDRQKRKLMSNPSHAGITEFHSAVTDALTGISEPSNTARPDVTQAGNELAAYLGRVGSQLFPTGLAEFDSLSGGVRAGNITGIIGLMKSGKSRIASNMLLNNLRGLRQFDGYVERFMDAERDLLFSQSAPYKVLGTSNPSSSMFRALQVARNHVESGSGYEPSGVCMFLTEKNKEQFILGLLSMMAIDYVKEGKRIQALLGSHASLGSRVPVPHEKWGYYHATDGDALASCLSADLVETTPRYKDVWAIRSAALELAQMELEDMHGRRLRIYDRRPKNGGLKNVADLFRLANEDWRRYSDYPMRLALVDYFQLLAEGEHRRQDSYEDMSASFPEFVNNFGVALVVVQQRNKDAADKEVIDYVPHEPGIMGGTAPARMLDSGVIAYGESLPKGATEEADPYFLNYRIWRGRTNAGSNRLNRVPVHPLTGRFVYDMGVNRYMYDEHLV